MEKLNFRGGGEQKESFLCMSGESGSLLYSSQHEFGVGRGLVSSAQRGAFLSGLPRGGAPAAASDTGRGDGGMEKMLGGSRKWTHAGSMKVGQLTTPNENICPCVFRMEEEEEEDAGNRLVTNESSRRRTEVMIGAAGWCRQIPKRTTQRV